MVAFTLWDIGQYKDCNCFLTMFCIKAFESILNFLNKLFFLNEQNVKTKIQISSERKEFLKWNKKHFLSFLQSFH